MTKKTNMSVAAVAVLSFLLCPCGFAQDGLNGELDDLLGLGAEESTEVAAALATAEAEEPAEASAAPAEAPAAADGADALGDLLAPAADEAPAAEVVAEAAPEASAAPAEEDGEVAALLSDEPAAPAEETAPAEAEEPAVVAAPAEEAAPAEAEEPVVAAAPAEEAAPAATYQEAKPAAALAEAFLAEEPKGDAPALPEAPVAAVEVEPVAAPAAEETPVAEVVEVAPAAPVVEVAPVAEGDADAAALAEIELLERMRRKALDEHGQTSLAKAQEEIKGGNYAEARRLFDEAKKFIVKRPENEKALVAAERGIQEAVYLQAEVAFKRGDIDGAEALYREARELGHPKAADGIAKCEEIRSNPPEEKPVAETSRWKDRDYRKNREQVNTRIKRARQYLITGEYNKARNELELILRDNPYNADAILLLRRVSDHTYDSNTQEFRATRSSMIQQVRETWTPSYRYAIDIPDTVNAGEGTLTEGGTVNRAGKTLDEATADKLRSITIPEINFKNATINEVIDFFIEASREYDDPQIPPEQRGVNLILKTPQATASDAALDEENIFASGAASSDGSQASITFSARYMSLAEALETACSLSQLKFRIRGNTVFILPVNEADADMISRSYVVVPEFESKAKSVSKGLSTRKQDSDGRTFFESSEEEGDTDGPVDWIQLFKDMGVNWPNGSSVKYLPAISKLRVFNTPENILEFEKALEELNVTPRQVEIEARFVEVAQTDLESLGFEWLLTDDWEIAKNKKDNSQHIKIGKGSGTSSANRYLSNGADLGNGIAISAVNDAILSVSSVLTNPELGFVLHMLSQQANTDLLSAPRVVTMDNEEAIIKVVREYRYPTEYEVKENDINQGDSDNVQVSYPMVEPQEFETREVGVILQVSPIVSPDGQMITLRLEPQIISDPEWEDFGFDYPLQMNGDEAKTLHLMMRQPIFKVRSVSTKISIYNGATVVLGGMITEERNEVNDKVPFLGDIPLVGRLFRSSYEKSEKRNLLIFVTARMVDPAGRTLKTNASDSAEASGN